MLKALINGTIVIGLSDKNLELLKQGRPINFNLSMLGLSDREVVIFSAKDEQEMYKMVKDVLNPETTIFKDDNAPHN